MDNEGPAVPDPAVSPDLYDDDYFRHCCMGAQEWSATGGREPAQLYRGILSLAGFATGMTVVDVGCGRGELVAVAAQEGAARSIGLDYAASAIELARQTIEVHGVSERAEVHHVDARRSPVEDGIADLVTLVDVVEHLTVEELHATLVESRRMLRPGGSVFVHTMPNRTIYDVTYPLLRGAARLRGHRWPADPRNRYEHDMHVNEQTRRSLRQSLRGAGFEQVRVRLGTWVHVEHLPEGRAAAIVRRLAATPGLRPLGIADLFATGAAPNSSRGQA